MTAAVARLRADAVSATLRRWPTATEMVQDLGFVQYDPIRRPAPAQDLILAARVPGYRVGRLEAQYARSGLDEDDLHVYGAMTPRVRALVHPRAGPGDAPTGLAAEVRAVVGDLGAANAREVADLLDSATRVNDWGGISRETTHHLEQLHHHGWLRVRTRARGARSYELSTPPDSGLTRDERLDHLILVLARLLAPVPRASLHAAAAQLQRNSGRLGDVPAAMARLMRSGQLRRDELDGVEYVRPSDSHETGPTPESEPARRVRFLAPFDPVVWDRRRFAHLWGWDYRFEAYIPPARRRFGYYALPMLWGSTVPGWVNVTPTGSGLDVHAGYVDRVPAGRAFQRAFDAEVSRLERMVGLRGLRRP